MKIYSCIINFKKGSDNQITHRHIKAKTPDAAVRLVLAHAFAVDLLLDGYSLNSKSVEEVDAYVAPFNQGKNFALLQTLDNAPEAVYIRVDGEYEDGFKRDLQALLSKYCPEIPTVFEGLPKPEIRWFLQTFRESTCDWVASSLTVAGGYRTKQEAINRLAAAANTTYRYRIIECEGATVFKPKTRWFLQFFSESNNCWRDSSCGDTEGYRTEQEVLDFTSDFIGTYRAVEREVNND